MSSLADPCRTAPDAGAPESSPARPDVEYRARAAARRAAAATAGHTELRISRARLATFAGALLVVVFWWRGDVSAWWLIAPVAVFVALVQLHDRAIRARDTAMRAVAFYERGLARIEDRWMGGGETGERFLDAAHLYANDLDLFGHGSLFELLSTARTRAGESTLARWLTAPAPVPEIRERQVAIGELAGMHDLREHLWLAGATADQGIDTDALTAWAEARSSFSARLRATTIGATLTALGAIAYWMATGDLRPLGAVFVLQILFARSQQEVFEGTLHAAGGRARDLRAIAALLERLENVSCSAPRLAALRDALRRGGVPASGVIRALERLSEMYDWQHSLRLVPLGLFLLDMLGAALVGITLLALCPPHLALAVDRWRRRHGDDVRRWLAAIGEFEALASLATYRHEHPGDCFPDVLATGTAELDGVALAHPLLPAATVIANDVKLAGDVRLLIVSGSNMSGKSTLLRTVGVNVVLALAGGPVRARSLQLSPLAIGATLRIQDSLQDGRSRFFAEITRVRRLADLAGGSPPLLFLLDEIFHGTNSHDRLAGASGVLRTLVARGAIGLVTTHDLALTALADALTPHAVNIHFEDRFEDGEMRFDYRMKPGPVTHSNAVALMRAVGLEV